MNVPIRMLGIANLIFWIILIGFIASAGYSIKDVSFNVGEPEFSTAPSGDITFSLPLYVDNEGYYDLKEFNVTSTFYSEQGEALSKSSSLIPFILKGTNATILHNGTLNIRQLGETNPQLLFNDSNLKVHIAAGFNFAELLPAQLSTNFTFPWKAPFKNLILGQPRYSQANLQNIEVSVPVSFENHATFDLIGSMSANLIDQTGKVLAKSQAALVAPMQSNFSAELNFLVPSGLIPSFSSAGECVEICFSTSFFDCGPAVVPFG